MPGESLKQQTAGICWNLLDQASESSAPPGLMRQIIQKEIKLNLFIGPSKTFRLLFPMPSFSECSMRQQPMT